MKLRIKNILKGERLTLKRLKPSFALAKKIFQTVDKNREHLKIWLDWVDTTKKIEDSFQFLQDLDNKSKKEKKEIGYGIYIKNIYVGNISIFDLDLYHKKGELGYWISKDYAGKGYTTEAVSILEKEYFENVKLNRIQIRCSEKNIASSKVAIKCGYKLEGKLRQYQYHKYLNAFSDYLIYSKLNPNK